MIHSMFTAITALHTYQTYLDAIADNVANANTVGFKPNRVTFQTQFATIINPGAAPNQELGGIDPTQIGQGVHFGNITPVFKQGMLRNTGRNLDISLQGEGFFVYNKGSESFYSRDGSLEIDARGDLVNSSSGMKLQGWTPVGGVINTNLPAGNINIPLDRTLARATDRIQFGGNLDSRTPVGGSSNVTYGVYDSLGNLYSVTVQFTRNTAGPANSQWTWNVTGATTANGTPVAANGTGTIAFDPQGQFISPPPVLGNITISAAPGSGAAPISIPAANIDMTGTTMLADTTAIGLISQSGLSAGSVSSVTIAANTGEIYLLYSNGLRDLIGQVAVAKFINPSALLREGQNLYREGLNSGAPNLNAANVGGRGTLVAGYLEDSAVDIAQEFTNMIVAQRGFQASARVITTSDEMMLELVNLKR